MKKSILSIGTALSKAEQKEINGGTGTVPTIVVYPSDPTGGWIDGSPEECALPFVKEGDRCVHICASNQANMHTWCN